MLLMPELKVAELVSFFRNFGGWLFKYLLQEEFKLAQESALFTFAFLH